MTKTTAVPKPAPVTLDGLAFQLAFVKSDVREIISRFESATAAVENERRLEETIKMLEARVADQAMQIARMEGYLDRVGEDDQEAAGMVEIEQPPNVVPRRPSRRYFGSGGSSMADTIARMSADSPNASAGGYARPAGRARRFRWSEDR